MVSIAVVLSYTITAIECAVEGECPISLSLEPIGPIDGIRLSAIAVLTFT